MLSQLVFSCVLKLISISTFSEGDFIKKLHTHAKDRVTEGVASYGKIPS